jgi:predicted NAD/FAD-dependent oxidoreductase
MNTAAQAYLPHRVLASQLHRWRYSRCTAPHPEPYLLLDKPDLLVFAGDGFGGRDIEGAVLSGIAAAEAILAT